MNSVSPQMLGLSAGNLALLHTGGSAEGQTAARTAGRKRLLRMVSRQRWVLAGGLVLGAAVGLIVTVVATRQYESTERLQISRDAARVVNVGALSPDVSIGDQEFYQTQYGLMRTQALAERVAGDLGVVDDPAFFRMFGKSNAFAETTGPASEAWRKEVAGQILLDHVVVAPVHGSSLVDIRATTPSKTLSQKIAQTWSRDFIGGLLDSRMETSGYASQFLESRLGQLRGKLEHSERQAMEYATAQGIIDLPSPVIAPNSKTATGDSIQARSLVTDDLVALNMNLEQAVADRIQAGSRLAAAAKQPDASSGALEYRAIGLMRKARADAASEYANLAARSPLDDAAAKASHAQIEALDAAIQVEEGRVHSALQQTYQAALTNENALTQRVTALKRSLADLRQRSIQYNIYQRDAATNRELYDALLQRYKEIGVAGAVESNNVAVVDPATSPRAPSSPRLSLNLGLFTLAGALLGAIAAAGLEQLDHGVTEPGEFEEKLGFPLLGMAPKSNGLAPLEALKKPRSDLAEAYLMVVANLELSTVQGAPRSLAVLSTRPREGKSATAIALAKSLARARRQVVLIDANLRAPSIHAAFGLSDVSGVSALLAGSDDIEAVLRSTEQAGLSIITAGADPSNPADLLVGDRLAKLVRALQERFDHVLVDGPSVGGFADALLVASAVQSVLYVVQAEAAPTSVVRAALGRLNPAQIAGGVLTMVKARRADRRDGRT